MTYGVAHMPPCLALKRLLSGAWVFEASQKLICRFAGGLQAGKRAASVGKQPVKSVDKGVDLYLDLPRACNTGR